MKYIVYVGLIDSYKNMVISLHKTGQLTPEPIPRNEDLNEAIVMTRPEFERLIEEYKIPHHVLGLEKKV